MSSRPFADRHIGPTDAEISEMLKSLGYSSLEEFMEAVVPADIRLRQPLDLPGPSTEEFALARLAEQLNQNRLLTSHIGMGYYGTFTPAVIRRNILENPGWYTSYTPYQAEIAQGRLEALLNFQTMVADLTGMDIANASLLDEATAVGEAVTMARSLRPGNCIFAAEDLHPQTLALLRTRCAPLGIRVIVGSPHHLPQEPIFAAVHQYPATDGIIHSLDSLIERIHQAGALSIVATDLLALALIKPPGECGADIVVGSAQRFGVPMGGGGPHPAFLATREEFKRRMPGRLVGVSRDAEGRLAYRLALQTREQHIRRDKATSNICTAQVLLAVMASMYAVYHGPDGLRTIARRIHAKACRLAEALRRAGEAVHPGPFFDTLRIWTREKPARVILERARSLGLNLRQLDEFAIAVAVDETTADLGTLATALGVSLDGIPDEPPVAFGPEFARQTEILRHPVFRSYHKETELQRYIRRLESKDISLTHSMIPLGSCTMKLNAASEMLPVSWATVSQPHPYAPKDQLQGFARVAADLENWLGEITGLQAVSLQPNAGSQGEYSGLLAIRAFHASRGESFRDVCLVPVSAHGTNPASAVLAGFRVVPVACSENGDISLDDLESKIAAHEGKIGALMITYPSTHGVFEEGVRAVCDAVHRAGGLVYLDGANMNAMVGIARPADLGADVCHLNLHKTFCIPHGGGGPGVGPICATALLRDFLPSHPLDQTTPTGPVAAAPLGSASILVISWMYLVMMGAEGLRKATQVAILNANYIAHRLGQAFPVLYRGRHGLVAHECILDLREWKERAGIEVEDVAKRLMDYGFHAPTMSWPVPGTLMVEPTESESRAELDRFCDAMLAIRSELEAIAQGHLPRDNNPLVHAPHTARTVSSDRWERPYSRQQAAYPLPWLERHKFWPSVARVDNVYGDRNVFCSCPPIESFGNGAADAS